MKVLCSVSSTTDASWFIHFMRCLEGIKTTCSWMLVYTSWRHKRKFVQFALDLFDGTISRENAPVDAGSRQHVPLPEKGVVGGWATVPLILELRTKAYCSAVQSC